MINDGVSGEPAGSSYGSTVAADGTRLAYQTAGAVNAPALLLLPGQTNSHLWWQDLRADFSSDHLTVTFDYRGTGDTVVGPADTEWSTALFADDAATVLRAIGRDVADVYATSMGGRVAQMLTLDHPSMVRRLVLAGSSPGGPRAVGYDAEVRRSLTQRSRSARDAALLDLMYTPAWAGSTSRLLGDPSTTAADLRRHVRTSAEHDALDRLPEIGVPTLILHGLSDRMVPPVNADLLHERIAGSTLITHPIGRHGFFDEFRSSISATVSEFIQQ